MIKDKKNLKRMGIVPLSIAWSFQDDLVNLWPFLILGGFYGFVWFMAWVLRNNP
jgi:hypothetical protein